MLKGKDRAAASGLRICLLLPVFGPRDTPSSSLPPPSNLLPSRNLRDHLPGHPPPLGPASAFLRLAPYRPPTLVPRLLRTIPRWGLPPAPAGPCTHLLCSYFDGDHGAPEGPRRLTGGFPEKLHGAHPLGRTQSQRAAAPSSRLHRARRGGGTPSPDSHLARGARARPPPPAAGTPGRRPTS